MSRRYPAEEAIRILERALDVLEDLRDSQPDSIKPTKIEASILTLKGPLAALQVERRNHRDAMRDRNLQRPFQVREVRR